MAEESHGGRKYFSSADGFLLRRQVCSLHGANPEKHQGKLEHPREKSPKQSDIYLGERTIDR
jgi:hypothetical protein